MNEMLLLQNIRNVLNRLEETIIFGFIERAQFAANDVIYRPAQFGDEVGQQSLLYYLLCQTEAIHAKMRRYSSPDEHPFFQDLPQPILPELRYQENPLAENSVNINDRIFDVYINNMVPLFCREGDDAQYGSSAVLDVKLLQDISRRIHYGKFVAESKFRADPEGFAQLVAAEDAMAIEERITNAQVEQQVLDRVLLKAQVHSKELSGERESLLLDPSVLVTIYRDWIIPLTKIVEVDYLLSRRRFAAI